MPRVEVEPRRSTRTRTISVSKSPKRADSAAPGSPTLTSPYGVSASAGAKEALQRAEPPLPVKLPKGKVLYTVETLAPAPSQTYYHLIVGDAGVVALHAFPKKRLNVKWSRESMYNPNMEEFTYEDFLGLPGKDAVVPIFGQDVYATACSYIQGSAATVRRG